MGVLRSVRAGAKRVLQGVGRLVVESLGREEKGEPAAHRATSVLEVPRAEGRPHSAPSPQKNDPLTPAPASSPHPPLLALPALQAACRAAGRPLILHHWATWCEPCEEELPLVQQLYEAVQGHADFLAISWDLLDARGTPEAVATEVKAFLEARGCTFPACVFEGSAEALFSGLSLSFQRIPQTLVVQEGGVVLRHIQGPLTALEGVQLRQMLMREASASAQPSGESQTRQ